MCSEAGGAEQVESQMDTEFFKISSHTLSLSLPLGLGPHESPALNKRKA